MKFQVVILALLMLSTESSASERYLRIVNGDAITPDQMPFIVRLSFGANRYCSGSLVNKQWIITARHCAAGWSVSSIAASVWGIDGQIPPFRSIRAKYSHHWSTASIYSTITGARVELETNDIVWLLLNYPIDGVQPVQMSLDNSADLTRLAIQNHFLTLAGWGLTGNGLPDTPYQVDTLLQNHIFTGTEGLIIVDILKRGSRVGDSGGPALLDDQQGNKVLAGVISSGFEDSRLGVFSTVIRLSAHYSKIISIIGWDNDEPWRWTITRKYHPLPPGVWHPEFDSLLDNCEEGQTYLCCNKPVFLCRDEHGQPGEMQPEEKMVPSGRLDGFVCRSFYLCKVINHEGRLTIPESFEVLTGSLYAYFQWLNRENADSDISQVFTSLHLPEGNSSQSSGSGTDLTPADEIDILYLSYCRVLTGGKYRIGRLEQGLCHLVDNSRYTRYELLYPLTPEPEPTPSKTETETELTTADSLVTPTATPATGKNKSASMRFPMILELLLLDMLLAW